MGHVTFQFRAGAAGEQAVVRGLPGLTAVAQAPARSPSGPGAGGSGGGGGASEGGGDGLISDRDLRQLEKEHAQGLTAVQVVHVFTTRGIRFSEATFRKYVQQGLLPRSRRVGRKGKHQGSLGLYPATTVRRINVIKRLMSQNYTIEDIQQQFLRYRDEIEALERGFDVVLGGFEEDLAAPQFDADQKKSLKKDLAEARRGADELLKRLEDLEQRLAAPAKTAQASKVAGQGGAEDLL
jgi:DNA-binding transcriptional MerR regulator